MRPRERSPYLRLWSKGKFRLPVIIYKVHYFVRNHRELWMRESHYRLIRWLISLRLPCGPWLVFPRHVSYFCWRKGTLSTTRSDFLYLLGPLTHPLLGICWISKILKCGFHIHLWHKNMVRCSQYWYPCVYESHTTLKGDIVHLKALTQNIIIVSSMEAASDLFDKRAKIYSDRFRSTMIMDLCVTISIMYLALDDLTVQARLDISWSLGLLNYGEPWRKARKFFHYHYNTSTIRQYDGLQFDVVRRLLRRLCTSPERFLDHSQLYVSQFLLYQYHRKYGSNHYCIVPSLPWSWGWLTEST